MKEINIQFYYKIFGQFSYISPLESETLFSIMRKSLLSVVFIAASLCTSFAQDSKDLFEIPDTVCVNQPIQLISNVPDMKSHYWGFCSGYLYNNPKGTNRGSTFTFDEPTGIEIAKNDDGNFYGFVINSANNTFKRLDYGTSLDNVPTVTDFGTMDGIFPKEASSMYMVRDYSDSNWYIFVTGGVTKATSTLSRIDFGRSLANTPNIVSFGNLQNEFHNPKGVFVANNGKNWYGFVVNSGDNRLLRFNMTDNISLTPSVEEVFVSDPSALNNPSDIAALVDDNKWYFFITNAINTAPVVRVDMDSLTNSMANISIISNSFPSMTAPAAITMVRDCGKIYGFISDGSSHDFFRMEMDDIEGPYSVSEYGNIGQLLSPVGMSKVIRDRDNVYIYLTNRADNSLSQVKFAQCNRVDIQYSTTNKPPEYRYDTAGVYNVYYLVNEGMPDMQVQCKLITVLPVPALIILPADTMICQGDTAFLRMISINAISYNWTPNYNISTTSKAELKVWPEYTTRYRVRMPFPLGSCVVDTGITVTVKELKADAGPDRTIADGASTLLGGPGTSKSKNLNRVWSPNQYIDDIYSDNPVVRPPHDFTYYLTLSDTLYGVDQRCVSIDTVVVYVSCEDVNLPNAFMPETNGARAKFGLMNSQVAKLEKFNIFDRWGKLVFTTTDPTRQWDGTINGEKGAVGVYVWEVDGFCLSGKRINKTGNVMLVR